jgi:hypothetical protein
MNLDTAIPHEKTAARTAVYEKFDYPAASLNRYIEAAGIFSILLKNRDIVHFIPTDADKFENWLRSHHIENIKKVNMNVRTILQ